MKRFATGAAFVFRDRKFQGLSGFEGKPFHPPLTDVPVGAYVIAPLLDVVAFVGRDRSWAEDLHVAAGYTLLAGAIFSVLTIVTGLSDWLRMRAGSEVRRISNSHALVMVTVSALVFADLMIRFSTADRSTSGAQLALGIAILVLVTIGAAIGGSLVFDKGFKVRARIAPAERSQDPAEETRAS
jgi:uncharacterized membrane protein